MAGRSLVDAWRADSARRHREQTAAALEPANRERTTDPADAGHRPVDADDTLVLLFLCCHPALSPPSQLALTLRAVGGLTTGEIAAAFLVPEDTMAKRISRAKQAIRSAGARFELPLSTEPPRSPVRFKVQRRSKSCSVRLHSCGVPWQLACNGRPAAGTLSVSLRRRQS